MQHTHLRLRRHLRWARGLVAVAQSQVPDCCRSLVPEGQEGLVEAVVGAVVASCQAQTLGACAVAASVAAAGHVAVHHAAAAHVAYAAAGVRRSLSAGRPGRAC